MTSDPKNMTEAEWRERLTPEQYHILREAGTERAFTGQYDKHYDDGTYSCGACGTPLFLSDAKYNQLRDDPHRGYLLQLRQPSGPRFP